MRSTPVVGPSPPALSMPPSGGGASAAAAGVPVHGVPVGQDASGTEISRNGPRDAEFASIINAAMDYTAIVDPNDSCCGEPLSYCTSCKHCAGVFAELMAVLVFMCRGCWLSTP